jgi:release factor glutamine methyltransferase
VLDAPRLLVVASGETPLTDARAEQFFTLVARRQSREPLQYILGTQPFMGCSFCVDERVLIPRQDTETLCEQALLNAPEQGAVLDLCTGSGALAVVIKKAMPALLVCASDVSEAAISLAQKNARENGADIDFRQGDLFEPFQNERFDMIVSNPPYIPTGELATLQEEVRREPALALDGGEDGLSFYRRIAREAPAHLKENGVLLMEIGWDQAQAVLNLLTDAGFSGLQVVRDTAGRDRVVIARNH